MPFSIMIYTCPITNHHPAPDFPHLTPEAPSPASSSDTNSRPRRPAPHALILPGAKRLQRIFITILCPVLLATQLHAQTELLPAGSDWQWLNVIDAATGNQIDPGTLDPDFHTTWHTSASYDGPAFSGPDPALLGYGGINAGPLATDIGTPTSGTRFTTYVRTTFTPEELVAGLRFEGLIDDGAIIYVNGQEVARINMDPGAADSYGLLAVQLLGYKPSLPAAGLQTQPPKWELGIVSQVLDGENSQRHLPPQNRSPSTNWVTNPVSQAEPQTQHPKTGSLGL